MELRPHRDVTLLADSARDIFDSPVGPLIAVAGADGLRELRFARGSRAQSSTSRQRASAHIEATRRQVAEYFDGRRRAFDLHLALSGPDFYLTVWRALMDIPYGETISYGELARRIGEPDAARAVGTANGANPIVIVVPCHRVIGANGRLVGYGGGLKRKRTLLDLEAGALTLLRM